MYDDNDFIRYNIPENNNKNKKEKEAGPSFRNNRINSCSIFLCPVDEREVVQGHERMGSERTDRGLGDAALAKCGGEVVRYSPGTVPAVTGSPAEMGEVGPYGLECSPKETLLVPLDGTAPDIKGTVK